MSEHKRSMRLYEKGLLAMWTFLIGIITMRAIRIHFSEWLKDRQAK